MIVTVTGLNTAPSCIDTIWLFDARTEGGDDVIIAADHRPSTELYNLLADRGEVQAMVDDWQITYKGRRK